MSLCLPGGYQSMSHKLTRWIAVMSSMSICLPGGYQSSEACDYAYEVDTIPVKQLTMLTRWIPFR
ncbi:hypothetical protein DPMN_077984 [Dreissena polymorpha]|uniref:Uncharacterized protein n=1 Tax=Dreissena polymorpha TaxID=45954 RepID=A0A9D3YQZ7_DREPO|nr:hypothetical protein DPMN_077984 [Dreissena polymorpha]